MADHMHNSSATDLIRKLGEMIGIPALCLDAQSCCYLFFDGSTTVEVRHVPAQSRWLVSCVLEKQQLTAENMQVLLVGNWLGAGFGGGWAGLDDQGRVVMHLHVGLNDATAVTLLGAMELLLNHSEQWERRLSEGQASSRDLGPMEMLAQRI